MTSPATSPRGMRSDDHLDQGEAGRPPIRSSYVPCWSWPGEARVVPATPSATTDDAECRTIPGHDGNRRDSHHLPCLPQVAQRQTQAHGRNQHLQIPCASHWTDTVSPARRIVSYGFHLDAHLASDQRRSIVVPLPRSPVLELTSAVIGLGADFPVSSRLSRGFPAHRNPDRNAPGRVRLPPVPAGPADHRDPVPHHVLHIRRPARLAPQNPETPRRSANTLQGESAQPILGPRSFHRPRPAPSTPARTRGRCIGPNGICVLGCHVHRPAQTQSQGPREAPFAALCNHHKGQYRQPHQAPAAAIKFRVARHPQPIAARPPGGHRAKPGQAR